jgi:hypothetical protein
MEKIQIRDKHNGSATLFLSKDPDLAFYLYADRIQGAKSVRIRIAVRVCHHTIFLNLLYCRYGSVIRSNKGSVPAYVGTKTVLIKLSIRFIYYLLSILLLLEPDPEE